MATKKPGNLPWACIAALALLVSTGCQTFNMSDEDFDKQQHGQDVNPQVGEAVGTVGTVAYFGVVLGELIAQASK